MPARISGLVPMLICEDVQEVLAFYTDVLGFEVRDRMDDVGRSGWASVQSGGARIMLASPTYIPLAPRIDGRHPQTLYYLYVDDVSALHRSVTESGWPATDVVVRFYGMKEFETTDPAGHVLVFGQDTDEAPTPAPDGSETGIGS